MVRPSAILAFSGWQRGADRNERERPSPDRRIGGDGGQPHPFAAGTRSADQWGDETVGGLR